MTTPSAMPSMRALYADDLEVVAGKKASKRPRATPDVGDRAGAVLDRRSGPVERVTGPWTETRGDQPWDE
jgi:hypothetical protein